MTPAAISEEDHLRACYQLPVAAGPQISHFDGEPGKLDAARWAPSDGRPGAGPGPQRLGVPGVPGVPGRWGGWVVPERPSLRLSQRSAAFRPSLSPSSWLGVRQRASWVTRRCPRGQLSGQHRRPWGRRAPSGLRGPRPSPLLFLQQQRRANTRCTGQLGRPLGHTTAADDMSGNARLRSHRTLLTKAVGRICPGGWSRPTPDLRSSWMQDP